MFHPLSHSQIHQSKFIPLLHAMMTQDTLQWWQGGNVVVVSQEKRHNHRRWKRGNKPKEQ